MVKKRTLCIKFRVQVHNQRILLDDYQALHLNIFPLEFFVMLFMVPLGLTGLVLSILSHTAATGNRSKFMNYVLSCQVCAF
jgi:hypothetical protein